MHWPPGLRPGLIECEGFMAASRQGASRRDSARTGAAAAPGRGPGAEWGLRLGSLALPAWRAGV